MIDFLCIAKHKKEKKSFVRCAAGFSFITSLIMKFFFNIFFSFFFSLISVICARLSNECIKRRENRRTMQQQRRRRRTKKSHYKCIFRFQAWNTIFFFLNPPNMQFYEWWVVRHSSCVTDWIAWVRDIRALLLMSHVSLHRLCYH